LPSVLQSSVRHRHGRTSGRPGGCRNARRNAGRYNHYSARLARPKRAYDNRMIARTGFRCERAGCAGTITSDGVSGVSERPCLAICRSALNRAPGRRSPTFNQYAKAPGHISTCIPSSTTRFGGIRKKVVARWEFRDMKAKRCSRQTAIPLLVVARMVSLLRK